MRKNRTLVIVGVMGALALVLGGLGIASAYAQEPEPPVDDRPFLGRGRFPGGGMFGDGLFGGRPNQGGYSLVSAAAEATGLSQEEVVSALREGQTFAQIAEGEGVDPQRIVEIALAQHETWLEAAVEAGRLTGEQVEERLADIEAHISDRLDETHEPGLFGAGRLGTGFLGRFGNGAWTTAFDAAADALGLDPTELFTRLHDGEGMAEIAEEQGVELDVIQDAVQDARVEARKQAIEEAVEAGRLTEEEAEWMLEGLEEGYVPGGRGLTSGRNCGPGGGMPGRGGRGRGMGW